MQHVTLVTSHLRLAIDFSQTFNEQEYFVDTLDSLQHFKTMMLQKKSVGIFWDLTTFPYVDYQAELTKIRNTYQIPILMLDNDKNNVLQVLQAGFDDYLIKPYSYLELIARLEQKQKLYQQLVVPENAPKLPKHPKIIIDDVVIDQQKYKAFKDHKDLGLTPKELKLLLYLIKHASQVLSRQQLLEGVWGDYYDISQTTRMVDIHISHLRDKIEKDPKKPTIIKTVRGFGYQFVGDYITK